MIHQVVCFGEMLWDIMPDKELPGGAVMNVAYNLQKLGDAVSLVSRVGKDDRGKALLDMLAGYGLNTSLIQVDNMHETGKVYADMTNPHDVHYDIVYPVAWDFISWEPALANLLQQTSSGYLVFGSLCSRHDISRKTLEHALATDVIKVLDINLRAPHYSQPHIEWLLQHAHILKLNITELELISGWYGLFNDKESAVRGLSARFNIPAIVVTMGGDGAMLFMDDTCHYQPGIAVTVADTIGSGDAFLAGLLHSLLHQRPTKECLAFANALGALVASYPGGCPDYQVKEIGEMMKIV
ncbi:fructokinase [Chitinophaga niastensis]|uniref:Fructokinase n=1 Tax=Chitinophaga niastensis TaxID=536980 RepID=A0A2P8HNW6_CHINA|nr:carbohydrate kinase [Chitinophaga niastensis]PSL47912.1 fructokinase [Chitinophaga niastensis]